MTRVIEATKDGESRIVPVASIMYAKFHKERRTWYLHGQGHELIGLTDTNPFPPEACSEFVPCQPGWFLVGPVWEGDWHPVTQLWSVPIVAWAIREGTALPVCPGYIINMDTFSAEKGTWDGLLVLPPEGSALGPDGDDVCGRESDQILDYFNKSGKGE